MQANNISTSTDPHTGVSCPMAASGMVKQSRRHSACTATVKSLTCHSSSSYFALCLRSFMMCSVMQKMMKPAQNL